jgi:phosphoglycerate dehydrogenase-like enzyme
VRIVTAVYDSPVWSLPEGCVRRIAEALPTDEVVDARTAEDRLRAFADADVLLTSRISSAEFAVARRVRWIQSTAVGVAELMAPEVVTSDVLVTNVRGVHRDQIAEHAIALMLALRRQLHVAMVRQASRTWAQLEIQEHRTRPLRDSQMLVVGLGAIGARVAELAAGLGMRVRAVRRHPAAPAPACVTAVAGPDALRTELVQADVVILAAPKTAETRVMIGAEELAAMKPGALLINVARGRLVDDEALVAALERGHLGGAGLDTFVREPLAPDHPFWRLPNVIVTPHVAPFGGDYWQAAIDLFLENVARFRRGEALVNVVDKTRGY